MWCPFARTRARFPYENSDGKDHFRKTSAKLLPQMLAIMRISYKHSFLRALFYKKLVIRVWLGDCNTCTKTWEDNKSCNPLFLLYYWGRSGKGSDCNKHGYGGEGGIRTHGTLRLTQLATERFRPLSHLSNSNASWKQSNMARIYKSGYKKCNLNI